MWIRNIPMKFALKDAIPMTKVKRFCSIYHIRGNVIVSNLSRLKDQKILEIQGLLTNYLEN